MATTEKRIARLNNAIRAVELNDMLAEAGRRMLAEYFAEVLRLSGQIQHEITAVSEMQQLVRRIQHVFVALDAHYKTKTIAPFAHSLKKLQKRLDAAVDSQTILASYEAHAAHDGDELALLQTYRDKAFAKLVEETQRKRFAKFAKAFTKFLTKGGRGAISPESETDPAEVRHLAPVLLHEALAEVRAYETALLEDPADALPGFVSSLQRLRDIVAFFEPLLGASIRDFEAQLAQLEAALQPYRLLVIAQPLALSESYMTDLQTRYEQMLSEWPESWARFNTRTTLRKFSDALLVLR